MVIELNKIGNFLIKTTIDNTCELLNKYHSDPTNIEVIRELLVDMPQLLPNYILLTFDECYTFFENNYIDTKITCKNNFEILLENINNKKLFKQKCSELKYKIDNTIIIDINNMTIDTIHNDISGLWYRAKHIIQLLGYSEYKSALKTNVPKEHCAQLSDLNKNYKSLYSNAQGQTLFIDEIGLHLLLHANHNKNISEIKKHIVRQSKLL